MPWKERALIMWKAGMSGRAIARQLGRGKSSVNEFLKPHKEHHEQSFKTLCFDIETAPKKVYVWNLWPKYIPTEMIIEDWSVLSWSAKWLHGNEMMNACISPSDPRDDFDVCEKLWHLFDEADIIVAHNGDRFDIRNMNQRWFLMGLNEPCSYKSVDTLKIAKRKFGFTSNKMDYISKLTGGPGKVKHEGFPMWAKCLAGDADAIQAMQHYNDGDVLELERIYLLMRGWDHLHPSVTIYGDLEETACPVCASEDVHATGRFYVTKVGKFPTYRCGDCGKVSRSRTQVLTPDQKKNIIVASK